jgi:hypothetical protein
MRPLPAETQTTIRQFERIRRSQPGEELGREPRSRRWAEPEAILVTEQRHVLGKGQHLAALGGFEEPGDTPEMSHRDALSQPTPREQLGNRTHLQGPIQRHEWLGIDPDTAVILQNGSFQDGSDRVLHPEGGLARGLGQVGKLPCRSGMNRFQDGHYLRTNPVPGNRQILIARILTPWKITLRKVLP